jgi:activator of HSP90 ATPase
MLHFRFDAKHYSGLRLHSVFSCVAHRAPIQSGIQSSEGTMSGEYYPAQRFQIPTRRQAIVGAACVLGAFSAISSVAAARSGEDIFRNAESLHQELVFKANRKRIYEIFTRTALFDNMTRDIQAQEGGNASPAHPTEISHDPGGAFSLFGGRIVGRHLELVPNERIVQAWRVAYWDPGVFSIVRFDFTEQGAGTKLVFAHTGFPQGDAENLLNGWKLHYWQPLEKFLAS